jgi:hypothetical protein
MSVGDLRTREGESARWYRFSQPFQAWHTVCEITSSRNNALRNPSAKTLDQFNTTGVSMAFFKSDTPEVPESPLEITENISEETWYWAALFSIAFSLLMKVIGRDHLALFIGQWPPTFLLLGLYRRLSK